MEALLGSTWAVFIGLTVVLFGGASIMMGQAMAETWRSEWHIVTYSFLMALADRFLTFALFGGTLVAPVGVLIQWLVLVVMALVAYRVTRARKMVAQYPWLYERAGLFGWREKAR